MSRPVIARNTDVQQRIILRVQRIGVRLVFREFVRRARMAFLAGGEDVGSWKDARRGSDGGRMSWIAVAVVAGGDLRRGIGLAQRHGLAVVGVPVTLQPVGVAFAAALVADGLEIIARRIDDFDARCGSRCKPARAGRLWRATGRERSCRKSPRCRHGICRRSWRRWRG